MRLKASLSNNKSSLLVEEDTRSIAGKIRLLANRLSNCNSILPVPLNSSKITSSILEPVSINAVASMVRDPPFSILRAAPKNCFGFCIALASTPPLSTLPDDGETVLCARANLVIESNNIITSCPHSTNRLAFCSAMADTFTCFSAGSSKVEAMTSAFTLRSISVTSSGRSSINTTIKYTSGWLLAIALAISLSNMVLPTFGWATIKPRWPFPMGVNKSIMRVPWLLAVVNKLNFS